MMITAGLSCCLARGRKGLCYQNIQDQLLRPNQMIQLEDPDQTETAANGENVQQPSADIWASYFLILSKPRGNMM